MAVIGMGIVFVSSKAATAQRDMHLQEIVVNQLRAALIQNKMGAIDICTTAPVVTLPGNVTLTATTQGCNTTTTATINGASVTDIPRPLSLKVSNAAVGGEIVVGGTWESI